MNSPWHAGALARSLDPLPDESLPGFLLRLSHRLHLSPRRVAVLTGLMGTGAGNNAKTSHLLSMDPSATARFAAATALSIQQVNALTLVGFKDRYPPLRHIGEPTEQRRAPLWGGFGAWVYSTTTRHCPDCLAGDGSTIQDLHGGSWRRIWRLAITFACVEHQQLLTAGCPHCRAPATSRDAPVSLIPNATVILHPAQCRFPTPDSSGRADHNACGSRLDAPAARQPNADISSHQLTLQQRLLDRLDPELAGTATVFGQPVTAAQYFADLRLVTLLMQITWPVARDIVSFITPIESLNASIARRLGPQLRLTRQLTERPPAEPAEVPLVSWRPQLTGRVRWLRRGAATIRTSGPARSG